MDRQDRDTDAKWFDTTAARQFFIGFLAGTATSAVVHGVIWHVSERKRPDSFMMILVLVLVKIGLSLWLLLRKRPNAIGLGLIASIMTGIMIFAGLCAANFNDKI